MNKFKHNKTFLLVSLIFLSFILFFPIFGIAQQATSSDETATETEIKDFPPETIIATFGDFNITLGDLNIMWEKIPSEYKTQLTKSDLLEQMISEKLMLQDAKNKDLVSDEKIAKQIDDMTNQILIQALIEKEVLDTTEVSDDEAREYYNINPEEFTEKEQVYLFHILVETEEDANAIREELNSGMDFSEVAKEKSTGPSAPNGGELGYISKGSIIPEIEEIVFSLEIDEISEIVKTDYGFHILKITDKKPEELKKYESVKENIVQTLLPEKQKEAFEKLIENLKAGVTIEINEEPLK